MQPDLSSAQPLSTSLLESSEGEHAALHDFGGDGPPLLLSHGNGLNSGMWRAVVPYLAGRYHCYGLDLRGHGACRPVDPCYSVERDRFADDVFAAIDALGGGPIYYAAHSLGGASAVFAALRQPEAFVGLWLFEPVVVPTTFDLNSGPSFLIEAARRRRMEFESVDSALENFMDKPPFMSCEIDAVRGYVEMGTRPLQSGGVRLSCEGEDEARVFESGQPMDFGRLAVITCPTVVASGENTGGPHSIPAAVAPLIAEALPKAVLEEHVGLTHFGPMENAAVIAASIIAHGETFRPIT
jgi:pimeloyl-ACP methyl ester carboxylesterase